jgi:hypothetical protein
LPGRSRKRGRHDAPGRAPATERARPTAAAEHTPRVATTEQARPIATTEQVDSVGAGHGRPLPSHLPPPRESRSEARNAEIRDTLRPYAPGERPRVVVVSAALAALAALFELAAWIARLHPDGQHPAVGGVIVFCAIFLACAVGLWRMWSGAVLGFMCVLAIIAVYFTFFLLRASNVLGFVISIAFILLPGYLFFKLVRVLSRLQVPRT